MWFEINDYSEKAPFTKISKLYFSNFLEDKINDDTCDHNWLDTLTENDELHFDDELLESIIEKKEQPIAVVFFKNNIIKESNIVQIVIMNAPHSDFPRWIIDKFDAPFQLKVVGVSDFDRKIYEAIKDKPSINIKKNTDF